MHWLSIFALAGSAAAAGTCPRAYLESLTKQYLAAQTAGHPSLFTGLTPSATFIENDVKLAGVNQSVLVQPMVIDHNRSIHDTVQCAAFSELIVTNPKNPCSVVDSVVTRPGDWAFNATGYVYWDSIEDSPVGPYEKVGTDRVALQAAADAYFDRFDDASVAIPLGTPCARLEGGAYTGRGNLTANTCNVGGFPSDVKVTTRQYIVDEVAVVVVVRGKAKRSDRAQQSGECKAGIV